MKNKEFAHPHLIITLINTTRKVEISLTRELNKLIPCAQKVFVSFLMKNLNLKRKGIKKSHLTLTLCGERRIRSLNNNYRNKDKVTDVLSFPMNNSLRPENCDELFLPELELGDVVICLPVAKRQALEFKITHAQEVIHELVHAFLHLVGYDHELGGKEEKMMFELEEKLVSQILF